ncbi:uncharacterized ABC transporter ATPase component, putative [Babesia ovata]|uniref:Uncharacterized ABC transporter ATPase component, putative n=1 Tax=Babesia ovata TaxID=189622 RepID=A0A2H6KFQ8_9APIC|nr:uncharacterized ABC transporter ATPase component, putative [Babesia ovata]GBE61832.1 uncharacterized ABC transporter ATPase component, putative [Babesia ovata]
MPAAASPLSSSKYASPAAPNFMVRLDNCPFTYTETVFSRDFNSLVLPNRTWNEVERYTQRSLGPSSGSPSLQEAAEQTSCDRGAIALT